MIVWAFRSVPGEKQSADRIKYEVKAMTKIMMKALIVLSLTVASAAAQEATVTPLMTQELAGVVGKEGSWPWWNTRRADLMPRTGTTPPCLSTCWKGPWSCRHRADRK